MGTRLASAVGALALAACGWREPDMVRVQAASDFHVDENEVVVRELREVDSEVTLYEASAKGVVAAYECTKTLTDEQLGTSPVTSARRPITVCTLAPPT
jgi:hypothetical protein